MKYEIKKWLKLRCEIHEKYLDGLEELSKESYEPSERKVIIEEAIRIAKIEMNLYEKLVEEAS